MTHDRNTEPTDHERTLPIQEGIAEVACRLLGDRADPEIKQAIRNAAISLAPAYVRPDRPVDIAVVIDDDRGMEVERETHLTRVEASVPEVLGASVGSAAASALRGYYVTDDGEGAARALDAAVEQMRAAT